MSPFDDVEGELDARQDGEGMKRKGNTTEQVVTMLLIMCGFCRHAGATDLSHKMGEDEERERGKDETRPRHEEKEHHRHPSPDSSSAPCTKV